MWKLLIVAVVVGLVLAAIKMAAPGQNVWQQIPAAGRRWVLITISVVAILWLTIWWFSPKLPAVAVPWSFTYRLGPNYSGAAVRSGELPAKVVRYDLVGEKVVLVFEIYYQDKDCPGLQTSYFQLDERKKGPKGTWHQDCPPSEGEFWVYKDPGTPGLIGLARDEEGAEMHFRLIPTK
jgi:hypothetical protein